MRRAVLALAAIPVTVSAAAAQQFDPNSWQPLTSPIVDGGVFNYTTKRWLSDPQATRLRAAFVLIRSS